MLPGQCKIGSAVARDLGIDAIRFFVVSVFLK